MGVNLEGLEGCQTPMTRAFLNGTTRRGALWARHDLGRRICLVEIDFCHEMGLEGDVSAGPWAPPYSTSRRPNMQSLQCELPDSEPH